MNVVRLTRAVRLIAIFIVLAAHGLEGQTAASERKWSVIAGVHFGTPAKKSLNVGIGRVVSRGKHYGGRVQRDVFFCVEPGSNGSRVALGYGSFAYGAVNGIDIRSARVSLFRRRSGDSSRVYLGPELSAFGLSDFVLGLRLGALVRVAGPGGAGSRKILPVIDFPIGW